MQSSNQYLLILVTAPSRKSGRKLAQAAVKKKLAACVNISPKIESFYWWNGKMKRSDEVLLLIKTTLERVAQLEKLIQAEHPSDVPEFIVIELAGGSAAYLKWLSSSVTLDKPKATRSRNLRRPTE